MSSGDFPVLLRTIQICLLINYAGTVKALATEPDTWIHPRDPKVEENQAPEVVLWLYYVQCHTTHALFLSKQTNK